MGQELALVARPETVQHSMAVVHHGTRCRLAIRQGPAERFRPDLYVLPDDDVGPGLRRRVAALQPAYSGSASRLGLGMAHCNTRPAA
jgi:hypothetical protein